MQMTRRYGYNNLVDPDNIDKDLLCPICQDIVVDPKECIQCQHIFCSECSKQWISQKNKCPFNCKGQFILQKPHRFVKNALLNLEVFCPDCHEKLTLDKADSHDKICKYFIIPCENIGCEVKCRRQSIDKHKKVCEFGQGYCKNCEFMQKKINELKLFIKLELANSKQEIQKQIQQQQLLFHLKENKEFCDCGLQLEFIYEKNNKDVEKTTLKLCKQCSNLTVCRYQCQQCNFYICFGCLKIHISKTMCPNKHNFELAILQNRFYCDYCRQIIDAQKPSIYCQLCEFVVCQSCFKKLPQQ